ncbi:MAG: S1C family serine protease [Chloroflexota bacterium]
MQHIKLRLTVCSLLCSGAIACTPSQGHDPAGGLFANMRRAPDFVGVAKDLRPAVVNVSATISSAGRMNPAVPQPDSDNQDEENMEQFFGVPPLPPQAVARSQGSGFIIGSDGVILTNAHVVEGAKKVTVRLVDKREFEAKVLGRDPHTDVAVIKIAANESLPTLKLGDSDGLEVGEWVIAVGNPFGLDNSLTSGIVSAKGRYLGDAYDRLIQTDANLNPGSSGGPLVDLNGKVVGINKAVMSQGSGNLGIGFATPINLVKEILPQLQSSGKVTRGWAGILIQEITPALAETMGLKDTQGALVAGVVRGSPAERVGIKVGDVITEYDGKSVTDALELPLRIARTSVNRNVALKLQRNNQEVRVNLTVAALPSPPAQKERGRLG